jgi:hypothetical protein
LAKFPLDERVVQELGDGTLTDQLHMITSTVGKIQDMLTERDHEVDRLNGILASQHEVVMKLTRGNPLDSARGRHA